MMRPDPRQHQIALARQTVLAEGMELTEALVGAWLDRAWIVQSWRRCLARGARPEAPVVFDAVSPHARARSCCARHAVGAGDKRIRAVIHIQQSTLRALEQ